MPDVAGIDVSARKLDVARLSDTGALQLRQFEQTPAGHRELAAYLNKHQVDAVVMEATGIYYLDAAVALHNAGVGLSVINPRAAHHFAKVMLQNSKTDRIDARLLAEYARRMTLKPWQAPNEDWLALRDIARRINQLTGMRTAEKNRLHALQAQQHTRKTMIDELLDHIGHLDHSIERLTKAAADLIGQDPVLAQYDACLTSTTGIARASAVALLGELCMLPAELRSSQVSRQAGLDVRLTESGSSIDQPGRLSKVGNTYLRAALYMPSLSLVRHDPRAKAHYPALIARGKKKMQALCAVQRKMLTGLWACMHANEPFDSARLFAIEPEKA